MDSATNSPGKSKTKPKSRLESSWLVVVPGLRGDDNDVQEHCLWDEYWLNRMEVSGKVILFDSGLTLNSSDRDILSPGWFDLAAERLLQEVEKQRKTSGHIVLIGEGLGGIILKRALILAEKMGYPEILRDVCACVLLEVPHEVPFVEAWNQVLISSVIPFWRSLPSRFWVSTAALPEWLESTSSDFVRFAYGFDLITVYKDGFDFDDQLRVCDTLVDLYKLKVEVESSAIMCLPHERLLKRSTKSRTAQFSAASEAEVKTIFEHLTTATKVPHESRLYMQRLSRLHPFSLIHESGTQSSLGRPRMLRQRPLHSSKMAGVELVSSCVRGLVQRVHNTLDGEDVTAEVILGNPGIGKSTISYHFYKLLLSKLGSSEAITFFAFDARDHRRRSVYSFLAKTIQQLLACQPELVSSIREGLPVDNKDIHWTEGNLWIQLRSIVRKSNYKSITMVVESVSDYDEENLQDFLQNLFDLRFAAPGRLKIVSTAATGTLFPEMPSVQRLHLADTEEFQKLSAVFRDHLADHLVLDESRLADSRAEVRECLKVSEGLLHSILLAYRIRNAGLLSCSACIESDLGHLHTDWKHTITDMVSDDPPWLVRALSWILFARRPLKAAELAVATILEDWSVTAGSGKEIDERVIPRDIEGDLRRYLGPLISVDREEIQISDAFTAQVLKEWLEDSNRKSTWSKITQTRRLIEYLRQYIETMSARNHKEIPDQLGFKLFEYAREQWHEHYREVMDPIVRPFGPHSAEMELEELALSLLEGPGLRWLRPLNPFEPESQSFSEEVDVESEGMVLAAQLGLFPLVLYLMNEDDKSDQLMALRVASEYGHQRIVQHLIDKINEVEVIELELMRACQRSDETIVFLLLGQYKEAARDRNIPPSLLPEVCRIGHKAIADKLINAGAKLDADTDGIPLLEAVDRGHWDVVDLLLNKGASAMALYPDNSTPLMHSIQRGYRDVSKRLLEVPGICDRPDDDGMTALHLAARSGSVELTKLILQQSPYNDLRKTPNVMDPVSNELKLSGNIETVSEKSSVDPKASMAEPREADESKEVDTNPEASPEEGPRSTNDEQSDISLSDSEDGHVATKVKRNSPLHEAVANGHLEVVKLLLENEYQRFDINEQGAENQSPLFLALQNDHEEIVSHLFNNGAEITFGKVYSRSALREAIRHGNLSATEKLLARAGPNLINYTAKDTSPLMDAAELDHPEIVDALLKAGAELNQKIDPDVDEDILGEPIGGGWSVMHFAAFYGSIDVMKLLVARDDIDDLLDETTESMHTPLHFAVAKDKMEIVEILLPGAKERILKTDRKPKSKCSIIGKERTGSISEEILDTGSSTPQSEPRMVSLPYYDVDSQTMNGLTALHIASASGKAELVKMLIVSGADVDITDSTGKGALHFAASRRESADVIVRILLERCDPRQRDYEGRTALHYAVEQSNDAVALLLLRHGVSPSTASHNGQMPLHLAARVGSEKVVFLLLELGADVNSKAGNQGRTALHAAAYGGNLETTRILVMKGADVNATDNRRDTPLHEAVRRGHLRIARLLVESGALINAVNARSMTPLHRAVLNQWTHTVWELLGWGADPNIRDEDDDTALIAALYSPRKGIVEALLDYGADFDVLNGNGRSPLMLALGSPDDCLQLLIEAGASVGLCDEDKVTVLHRAAAETTPSNVEGVKKLLEYGKESLNISDAAGLTPLHHAAKYGQMHMIIELQKHDAILNAKDAQGRTPMHYAVRLMKADDFKQAFAEFLRPSEENNVNIADSDGWTPLHWACQTGNLEIVNLLLESCGSDEARRKMILNKGEHGWTALGVAEFHRRSTIKRALGNALGLTVTRFIGADVQFSVPTTGSSEAPTEVNPDDIRAVKPGTEWSTVQCDDCLLQRVHGIRYKCNSHADFDLCFKCFWHHENTHTPQGHTFTAMGEGPATSPEFAPEPKSQAKIQDEIIRLEREVRYLSGSRHDLDEDTYSRRRYSRRGDSSREYIIVEEDGQRSRARLRRRERDDYLARLEDRERDRRRYL